MSYSMAQANALLDTITTSEQLRVLIRQLDITATGKITILYSGYAVEGIYSGDIVQGMLANGEEIRVIDNTEAAKFLNTNLGSLNPNGKLIDVLGRIMGDEPTINGSKSNQFLFGRRDAKGRRIARGEWDYTSIRFIGETVGEVRTITGGAKDDSIFAQSDMPAILQSKTITDVDGIAFSDLKRLSARKA